MFRQGGALSMFIFHIMNIFFFSLIDISRPLDSLTRSSDLNTGVSQIKRLKLEVLTVSVLP